MTKFEDRLKMSQDIQNLNKEHSAIISKIIEAFKVTQVADDLGINPSQLLNLIKNNKNLESWGDLNVRFRNRNKI